MGTLNGSNVFGLATSFEAAFDPTAAQINEFFGVDGTMSLHGGERGFVVMVSGVFFGETAADVVAAEGNLLSYRDGRPRLLVDNFLRAYPNVIFDGPYQDWGRGIKPASYGVYSGWALPYKAVFRGLGGGA